MIGFSYDVMRAAKRELPELKCYWIVELKRNKETGRWSPQLATLIRKAKDAGLDGIDLAMHGAGSRICEQGQAIGARRFTWTVDSVQEAKH